MKSQQLIFNNKYKTSLRIGCSEKCQIYLAHYQQKQYAIKLQPEAGENTVQNEAKYLKLMQGGTGIPHLYWYGVQHSYRALVMDILGPSLEQLVQSRGVTLSLKTVLQISGQVLQRIEWIHSKGLIYNDVDPCNFLVGLGAKCDKIFIVDMGNCRKYKDAANNFFFLQDGQESKCKLKFKTMHMHIRKRTGRRDDLEALGYMLVYLLKGSLPWDQLDDEVQVKEKKVAVPYSILCEGLPKQFTQYFEYVSTLEFEEEPDYKWMQRLFKDLFQSKGYINNRVMDWSEG